MNNLNIWEQFMQQAEMRWSEVIEATSVHIQLVFFSMLIAIVLGIGLGILITRVPKLSTSSIGWCWYYANHPEFSTIRFYDSYFRYWCKHSNCCSISYIHFFQLFETHIQVLKM